MSRAFIKCSHLIETFKKKVSRFNLQKGFIWVNATRPCSETITEQVINFHKLSRDALLSMRNQQFTPNKWICNLWIPEMLALPVLPKRRRKRKLLKIAIL
jgi:hypothetical protein